MAQAFGFFWVLGPHVKEQAWAAFCHDKLNP